MLYKTTIFNKKVTWLSNSIAIISENLSFSGKDWMSVGLCKKVDDDIQNNTLPINRDTKFPYSALCKSFGLITNHPLESEIEEKLSSVSWQWGPLIL